MAVAVGQGHGFKPFARPPRCKLRSFTQLDYKMLNFSQSNLAQSVENALEFSSIHKSFSTPCLSHSSEVQNDYDTTPRIKIIAGHSLPSVRSLVLEVAMAMASGLSPELVSKGLGGAYLLHASNGHPIAVAKPIDEEPLAFNNPKGLAGRKLGRSGMKCSIKIGETGVRELAAYFLDHDCFAGVPPTALVRFSNVKFNLNNSGSDPTLSCKIASLQQFVNHDSDAGDLGPSSFTVGSVHHIGILDIRLMNLDRHAGNILVKHGRDGYAGGTAELVPIDHGFCLPETLDDPYFEWLHWPQALIPFSEADINYISRLDPYKDAELLKTELPSIAESAIRVLVLCTIFLKQATAHGLCLADTGAMMTREICGGKENLSTLESLCIKAGALLKHKPSSDDDDDDNNNNQHKKEGVNGMVRFDEHAEDHDQMSDIPNSSQNPPTKGKPSKIPRISPFIDDSAAVLFPSNTNELYHIDNHALNLFLDTRDNGEDIRDDSNKIGSFPKSLSFPAPIHNRDWRCISFGEMDNEEWRLFLECFEMLLPETFEERKSLSSSMHRSSCEF